MNAQVQKNVQSATATAIAAIMNDAAASENKQAALVVSMFESEVTFPNDILLNMLRKEKKERTQARENLIRSISDDYATALDTIQVLKDKGKNNRTEKEAFQVETLTKKVRAANIMFERAAITVIGLRESKVKKIKASNIGAGALEIMHEEEDAESKEKYMVKSKASAAAALSSATKITDKLLGKKKEEPKAANPAAQGMTQTIETVSRYLDISMKKDEGAVVSIHDFADATETALEQLFAKLFFLKFGTGADANMKDVKAYAMELGSKPITPAQATVSAGNGNGKAKEGNGEKKAANA